MNGSESSKDYDSGYFEGRTFARRSTPRLPTRSELEDIAQAFSEQFDYELEEAWAILLRSYIAVFESYKGENGFISKIACVCYETSPVNFDHYSWAGGTCSIIERAK